MSPAAEALAPGPPHDADDVTHVVVMGVSGCGKSSVGQLLAERLGWPFVDADDLHPPSNVAKMAAGAPLDDADRAPWLAAVRDTLDASAASGTSTVLACSALRRAYRDVLAQAQGRVRFVHLEVGADLLSHRVATRASHFMPASLVGSQLTTLEPLAEDEDGVTLAATGTLTEVAQASAAALALPWA